MGAETLCYLSLHDLSGRIRRGDVSPVEAVEAFLQRIEQLNPRLTYFTHICHELPHAKTENGLPPHIRLAYDGLELTVGESQ